MSARARMRSQARVSVVESAPGTPAKAQTERGVRRRKAATTAADADETSPATPFIGPAKAPASFSPAAPLTTSTGSGHGGAVWRKVLWAQQPFADNYTDASFLDCLSTNAGLEQRQKPLSTLMLLAMPIALRVASLALWMSAYFALLAQGAPPASVSRWRFLTGDAATSLPPPFTCPHTRTTVPLLGLDAGPNALGHALCSLKAAVRGLSPLQLVAATLTAILVGTAAAVWARIRSGAPGASLREAVRERYWRLCMVVVALVLATPVLRDLARPLSEDAVVVIVVVGATLHTALHNYSDGDAAALTTPAVGANASTSTSTTRDTGEEVFGEVFGMEMADAGAGAGASDDTPAADTPASPSKAALLTSTDSPATTTPAAAAPSAPGGDSALSFNAIVLASVALCSRLPDDGDSAYAFLLFSTALFAGLPGLARVLRAAAVRVYVASVLAVVVAAWLVVTCHSPVIGYCYCAAVFGLVLVGAPAMFRALQRSAKQEYAGPWDYDDGGEQGAENI